MRVLFVTPYVPGPIRVRPYRFLNELATRHHITVLCPIFDSTEQRAAAQLEAELPLDVVGVACSKEAAIAYSLRARARGLPMQAQYCYSPALMDTARRLQRTQRFDLVHVEHLRMSYMGAALTEPGLPVVYDAVDCISLLVERTLHHGPLKNRAVSLIELGATRKYESWLMRAAGFAAVCVTGNDDGAALTRLAAMSAESVRVIPNGLDMNAFSPPPGDDRRDPATVVFSGKMSYHANIAAARYLVCKIWPLVRRHLPNARLFIVGSQPPRELRRLSGRDGITVTGYVPTIRPYLQRATVAVAPMVYSVGIQNKVLEALACATPVVATRSVLEALGLHDRQDAHLVEPLQANTFAQRIVEVIENPAAARDLGVRGHRFVADRYANPVAAARLETLWQETHAQYTASSQPLYTW